MTKTTLVVLAAGIGSRYGGIKQLDEVSHVGETIIDFSLYDAIGSGFSKVVFVVRESIHDDFRKVFDPKLKGRVETHYVCQETDKIPAEFLPTGRSKPWGTGQALLTTREIVDENFGVINADDFYGKPAFEAMFAELRETNPGGSDYSLVGYPLVSTLSDTGSVSRGQCVIDHAGMLNRIVERMKIVRDGEHILDQAETRPDLPLDENTIVSMNFWGFTPRIFEVLESEFRRFLKLNAESNDDEFLIPTVVDTAIKNNLGSVKVLEAGSKWLGMTYKEDKEDVVREIKLLKEQGMYPEDLWE